jgi:hypothetical protein
MSSSVCPQQGFFKVVICLRQKFHLHLQQFELARVLRAKASMIRGCIFGRVQPFYERAVSDLDP